MPEAGWLQRTLGVHCAKIEDTCSSITITCQGHHTPASHGASLYQQTRSTHKPSELHLSGKGAARAQPRIGGYAQSFSLSDAAFISLPNAS